ncbi:hypothetical protein L195_g063264, partial [Trifolium pratense]
SSLRYALRRVLESVPNPIVTITKSAFCT